MIKKPKLVLLRSSIDHLLPVVKEFAFLNRERGLKFFFELEVVSDDLCYNELIDNYNPDIIAFFYHPLLTKKIKIEGIDVNNMVPKIGLMSVDEISPERYIVVNYFESCSVHAIFSIGSSISNYYPSLTNKIYYWPWFINENDTYDFNFFG